MRALVLMFFLVLASQSLAATIHLNDGRTITGNILEQTGQSVKVEADGVAVTYFLDEIKDIEGSPWTKPAGPIEALSAPAPVAVNAVASADAQEVNKQDLILKFIDVFGTRRTMEQNFEWMVKKFEKDNPKDATRLRERVRPDEIIQELIPIYDRNFSVEELQAFIAFYGSPAGKKLLSTIPVLMQQSVQVSYTYLVGKFPELAKKDSATPVSLQGPEGRSNP